MLEDQLPSLDELQRKINTVHPEGDQEPSSASTGKQMGEAMQSGIELMAGVAVGGALGYGLDRFMDSSPWFFILGFFLGFAAGLRNIMRNVDKG